MEVEEDGTRIRMERMEQMGGGNEKRYSRVRFGDSIEKLQCIDLGQHMNDTVERTDRDGCKIIPPCFFSYLLSVLQNQLEYKARFFATLPFRSTRSKLLLGEWNFPRALLSALYECAVYEQTENPGPGTGQKVHKCVALPRPHTKVSIDRNDIFDGITDRQPGGGPEGLESLHTVQRIYLVRYGDSLYVGSASATEKFSELLKVDFFGETNSSSLGFCILFAPSFRLVPLHRDVNKSHIMDRTSFEVWRWGRGWKADTDINQLAKLVFVFGKCFSD